MGSSTVVCGTLARGGLVVLGSRADRTNNALRRARDILGHPYLERPCHPRTGDESSRERVRWTSRPCQQLHVKTIPAALILRAGDEMREREQENGQESKASR
jgi:hypothetical protein